MRGTMLLWLKMAIKGKLLPKSQILISHSIDMKMPGIDGIETFKEI
jgi:hypothetical protein